MNSEKSRYMLFVESNTTGSGMEALKIAKNMGFLPVLISNNLNRYIGLSQIDCLTYECDTNSITDIINLISSNFNPKDIIGITTTSEFYIIMVSRLCSHYNLPSNTTSSLAKCRNKSLTREALETNKIKQPRFKTLKKLTDLEIKDAINHLGLPCVIKPVDDTGSNKVKLCFTLEEVFQASESIMNTSSNVRGQETIKSVLIEEYIDAPEFSVEMFSWNGEHRFVGITKKVVGYQPNFVETQHIFPASVPASIGEEVKQACIEVLNALEIKQGPTHIEMKILENDYFFIEVNARLAGGMIPELIKLSTGMDLLKEQLRISCNLEPKLIGQNNLYSGIAFITTEKNGILKGIDFEKVQTKKGIEQITVTKKIGDYVQKPTNAYDRLGYIIVKGYSEKEVESLLSNVLAQISIEII